MAHPTTIADASDSTFISRLSLSCFRNYETLGLDLHPGAVVFTGENGSGKTNLLEAISFLSPGRGLRRTAYAEIVRQGTTGGFAIHARVERQAGRHEVGTGTIGAGSDGGRRIRINGSDAKSSDELLEIVRVLWMTPAMDGLFTGSPGDRRRFLDRLVLAIDARHAQRTMDYEKAMRGRNRLLAEAPRDGRWLDAIEAQLAELGVAIAAARSEVVWLLSEMVAALPESGPFPRAELALQGQVERALEQMPAVEVEEHLRRQLSEGRSRDRVAGRTLDGPHRSDLLVRHSRKSMDAALCSTGEQKALLIGLILSHARLTSQASGMSPIMLLDEVAAHLDPKRRMGLFSILEELRCQTFMTGTEINLFDGLQGRAQFLLVSNGVVQEAP